MTIREQTEALERQTLSKRAALACESQGRDIPIEECPLRTCYQRDRDRIIHCKSFRRLKHKTQVFLAPQGDHYRTRLTHTLEVAQIARTIARGLRLNEDLTEAVAMGHDLGHTPFGHAGERALNEICPYGYKHYLQSVRIVERLEKDGKGLNLTKEVRDGIACHTTGPVAKTLEGQIVRYADRIAYINHDIEDATRAGVMEEADIPDHIHQVLGDTKSKRITTLVSSVIDNSTDEIRMDDEIFAAYQEIHHFMFEKVYTNPLPKGEEGKAQDIIIKIYEYFIQHPEQLPDEYKVILEQEDAHRAVCDYVSGMSDYYAIHIFSKIFIPQGWSKY